MFRGKSLLMHKRAGGLCLVLLILVFSFTGPASAEDTQNQVRIGVLAKRGPERCMEKWSPTARYLSEQIPGYSFEIVPLDFEEVNPAVKAGEVDFLLVNPAIYIEVETYYGVSRIATLKNLRTTCVCTVFGGVIFHRADRDDIKCFADLKGKRFMAVDVNSFGGWQAAWREMKEVDIDPHSDFKSLEFGGTHDAVVYAVRDGKVDAGTVRTDTLDRMAAEGKIRMEDFRALKHDHIGEDVCEFPFLHSTDMYPEWPFAKLKHISDELAEKVAVALIKMPADCQAAKAARCAGWTIPANYQPVHECLKELRVGPYKNYGKVTLSDTVRNYWYWLVVIVAALAAMAGVMAYVLKLNRRFQNSMTERKQAEESIRRLATIAEQAGEGIAVAGLDGTLQFANMAWVQMHGYDNEHEFAGKPMDTSHTPEQMETDVIPFNKEVHRNGSHKGEIGHVRKDGTTFPTEMIVTLLKDESGKPIGFIAFATDITERKQAEEALRSSESKFRTLYEATSDAVMLLDEKGFFDCNDATLRVFGCDNREQFLAHHPSELSPATQPDGEDSRVAADGKIATAMTEGSNRFEWMHCRVKGSEFPAEVLLNRMELAGRTVLQAVVRDISKRKETEEALRRAKEMAEAATRAKSGFLANMSHEIRTPMTAILGYTDLMMDPRQGASERLNCLSVVRRNGEHLLGLINDILDISRIEAGKFTIEKQPCSVPAVIAEVTSTMRVRADERGISLTTEYTSELPEMILTDQVRLRQGLINLVGNAVKFTETGGVKLIISFLPKWRDDKPAVRIDVADTGIGIAPDDLKRLFQPFAQVDSSTSRKYEGNGLGLAITRHIVELMGGELSAESTPGKGSTFTMTIPTGEMNGVRMLTQPDEAVFAHHQAGKSEGFSSNVLAGKHVLVAEDGEDNMRLIRAILRKAGADVFVAENGRIAVDLAMREPFDMILMDMQMPEMDGYQATSYLRSAGYNAPIIALTAHAMAFDRERCISAGCDDYLTKPIDRGHLVASIAGYLNISSADESAHPQGAADAQAEPPAERNDQEEIIRSCYDDDEDLGELIDKFVGGLPGRIEEMRQAAANNDFEHLKHLAHQLKGAGGGYGYPMLTETAKSVEDAAKSGDIEVANITLNRLAGLCCAVVRGRDGAGVTSEIQTDENTVD